MSEGVIGAVLAAYGIASLAARVPGGMLYRSHRGPWLVAGGCLLSAVGFACIPLTSNPLLVCVLIALDGIGFSIATTGVMAALIERRPPGSSAGSIMGWYTGAFGLGYATAGFAAGSLADAIGVGAAILALAAVPVASGLMLSAALRGGTSDGGEGFEGLSRLRDFRHLPALVWLAFLVSLYINLVNGVLFTFFPIYAVAAGLSLTQVGVLTGIHGAAAAAVRFAAGVVFRHVSYARVLPLMVGLSGLAVAALPTFTAFALLAVAWSLVGLTRGVLRVASGALVMDTAGESEGERGAASGVYLAGLDLGKIAGPIFGGLSTEAIGLRGTFLLVAIAFPVAYLVVTAAIGRRARVASVVATSSPRRRAA